MRMNFKEVVQIGRQLTGTPELMPSDCWHVYMKKGPMTFADTIKLFQEPLTEVLNHGIVSLISARYPKVDGVEITWIAFVRDYNSITAAAIPAQKQFLVMESDATKVLSFDWTELDVLKDNNLSRMDVSLMEQWPDCDMYKCEVANSVGFWSVLFFAIKKI